MAYYWKWFIAINCIVNFFVPVGSIYVFLIVTFTA